MNILNNPYYRANVGKSGFNLSCRKAFSTMIGFLQPFMCDVLTPGEKVSLNDRVFIRSETMTTSPFTRIHFKTEYFFVPFPQLWSFFGSFFYGIKDFDSSSLEENKLSTFPKYPSISAENLKEFEIYCDTESDEDIHGIPFTNGMRRICDGFNIQYNKFNAVQGNTYNDLFPLFYFQAYQRVFDAFYRNDTYDAHDRKSYNVDDLSDNSFVVSRNFDDDLEAAKRLSSLLQPRYRNMPRDFFTNILPSPLFNSLSVDSFRAPLNSFVQDLEGSSTFQFGGRYGSSSSTVLEDGNDSIPDAKNVYSVGQFTQDGQLTPSAIRNLFATEKLLSITQRTKKDYQSQTLAHFGYDVPDNIGSKVFYIGGNEGLIQMTDVNATATTSGDDSSVLGEVAGKGIGVNGYGKDRKFTAPWHGVLLGIFSIWNEVIYPDYVETPLAHMVNRDHFFFQEFDRLGMTPAQGKNYVQNPTGVTANKVVGWQYRYSHLKQGINRCWGSFMNTDRNWITKRLMFDNQINNLNPPLSFFYYSPNSLDDVMLVPFAGNVLYSTDPFKVDLDLKYFKSSTMSTYGLPQL